MSPAKRRSPLRNLPSVSSLLESPELSSYKERAPHDVLAEAVLARLCSEAGVASSAAGFRAAENAIIRTA